MRTPRDSIYAGHRYPAEIISYSVWLYFRFPLSLRMVEEMLAARGISVTHETIRQWGLKFGREFANRIRGRAPRRGDKWHLDEVAVSFAGKRHWLWRAVDQDGFVLDVLVQSRRDKETWLRLSPTVWYERQGGSLMTLCAGAKDRLLGSWYGARRARAWFRTRRAGRSADCTDAGPASGHRQDRSLGGPLPTAFTRPDPSCRSPTRQR